MNTSRLKGILHAFALMAPIHWLTSCAQEGNQSIPVDEPQARSSTTEEVSLKPTGTQSLMSYTQWMARCASLPTNRQLKGALPDPALLPIKEIDPFTQLLDVFFEQMLTGPLGETKRWVREVESRKDFLDLTKVYFEKEGIPFMPFAMKLELELEDRAHFHGDLHGDIHSLNTWLKHLNQDGTLNGFELTSQNDHLIFLGDYTDRGAYGVEVMYVLMRLKTANPQQVWMARGNHEDIQLTMNYGFLREATSKFGPSFPIKRFSRLYDMLPVVIYVGHGGNYIQCNHGGVEPGYQPSKMLSAAHSIAFDAIGQLEQKSFLDRQPDVRQWMGEDGWAVAQANYADFKPTSPTTPKVLGFMWNDFSVSRDEPQLAVDPGRAFVYGDRLTNLILESHNTGGPRVQAIFRAHQHSSLPNPLMRRLVHSGGVFRHWQERDVPLNASENLSGSGLETSSTRRLVKGAAYTFNVSPDSNYGIGNNYQFDTFGRLHLSGNFEDWKLEVIQLPVNQ